MKWKKPSGMTIETNDRQETIDHCLKLGWKEIKKRGPKPKKVSDGDSTEQDRAKSQAD